MRRLLGFTALLATTYDYDDDYGYDYDYDYDS